MEHPKSNSMERRVRWPSCGTGTPSARFWPAVPAVITVFAMEAPRSSRKSLFCMRQCGCWLPPPHTERTSIMFCTVSTASRGSRHSRVPKPSASDTDSGYIAAHMVSGWRRKATSGSIHSRACVTTGAPPFCGKHVTVNRTCDMSSSRSAVSAASSAYCQRQP